VISSDRLSIIYQNYYLLFIIKNGEREGVGTLRTTALNLVEHSLHLFSAPRPLPLFCCSIQHTQPNFTMETKNKTNCKIKPRCSVSISPGNKEMERENKGNLLSTIFIT
jgi:hypothetical protein